MDILGLVNYGSYLLIFVGIYALLTLGLNIQWGFAGLFNVGIAGFFAIGAYTCAILTSPVSDNFVGGFALPVPIGVFAGMLLSVIVAWPIGKICLRFRSDYLAIATIGIAEIMRLVIKSEQWLTNGSYGINKVPRPFGDLPYTQSQLAFLGIVVVILLIAYLLVQRQQNSPWGRMMRAIRDNELAARAMGKNIEAKRLHAFLFGAALMGLGGAMYALFNRSIFPEAIDPMIATFLIWIMLILGGSGNNRGALLGTLVVWLIWSMSELVTGMLPDQIAIQATYIRMFLIGLILQLVLRFRPEGILPEPLHGERNLGADRDEMPLDNSARTDSQ